MQCPFCHRPIAVRYCPAGVWDGFRVAHLTKWSLIGTVIVAIGPLLVYLHAPIGQFIGIDLGFVASTLAEFAQLVRTPSLLIAGLFVSVWEKRGHDT